MGDRAAKTALFDEFARAAKAWPAAGASSCWTCSPTASGPWRPWPARSA